MGLSNIVMVLMNIIYILIVLLLQSIDCPKKFNLVFSLKDKNLVLQNSDMLSQSVLSIFIILNELSISSKHKR